jgi:predicted amidohydrolase
MTRLALAQIRMHWEMADNLAAMQHALRRASDAGAALCAFSELAVTGFHRRIVDWARPELSGPAVDTLRATARALGIATVFGAPTYTPTGGRLNSHLFVDADGTLAGTVSKMGLTAPEATFFEPGADRPVVTLAGRRCTAVICREIEDAAQIVPALAGQGAELIFWPGQMRPDPDLPPQDPPRHVVQAQDLARACGAWVLQSNWPNALNRPEETEGCGHSACIDPSGRLRWRLPVQGHGIGVFTLGEDDLVWLPDTP